MVVDEAQDISSAAFELIRAAVAETENDLFIVGMHTSGSIATKSF